MPFMKSIPLCGLEREPEVLRSLPAARKQEYRQGQTRELAEALAGGVVEILDGPTGPVMVNPETGEVLEDRAAAFAALLMLSGEDQNNVTGSFESEHGPWSGATALWKSSLRLDPNCMETLRRRSRCTAREALARMFDHLPSLERFARKAKRPNRLLLKLVTLTMPHLPAACSVDEVKRINRAFALMSKRAYWKAQVWGGVKGIEDALTFRGPHVHIHALVLARFIDRETLRREWGECVTMATEEATGETYDQSFEPFIDVRLVTRKGKSGREGVTDIDEAIHEVTKYVTKPSDLLEVDAEGRRIPREVLLELCEVKRWPRMFELLGQARERVRRRPSRRELCLNLASAATAALDSIQRAYLTGTLADLPENLRTELADRGAFDTDDDAECNRRQVEALRDLQKVPPKRKRPPSWRDLLDVLTFGMWLSTMVDRAASGRKFRLSMLADRFPGCRIVVFDGRVIDCPA